MDDRTLNSDLLEKLLDQLLPRENKKGFEPYSLLLWELDKLGISTTKDLAEIIRRHLRDVLEKDRAASSQYSEPRTSGARGATGAYFSHLGLVRLTLEREFGDDYYSKVWSEAEHDYKRRMGRRRKSAG